jgi:hypothetical protein
MRQLSVNKKTGAYTYTWNVTFLKKIKSEVCFVSQV